MNGFKVLTFLFTLGIAYSNAGIVELLTPQYYDSSQLATQPVNLADSFGPLSYSVGETNIVRKKRAFDTYITAFCYSPQVTIFDFSKKI